MTSDPRIERARFVWRFSVLTEGQVALALLVAMLLLAAAAFAYPAIAFTGEPRGADPERVRRLRGGIATTFEEFRPLFGEVTTLTPVGD